MVAVVERGTQGTGDAFTDQLLKPHFRICQARPHSLDVVLLCSAPAWEEGMRILPLGMVKLSRRSGSWDCVLQRSGAPVLL